MKVYIGMGDGDIHPWHYQWIDDSWTCVDKFIKRPGVLEMDARELTFPPDTVEAIYASHLVEHISHTDVPAMLQNWLSVLKPQGTVHICVPDMEWIADQLLKLIQDPNHKMEEYGTEWDLVSRVIYGTHHHPGEIHYSGYTQKILTDVLVQAGFTDVVVWKEFTPHMIGCLLADCKKP